jgi:hypothetical protein
VVLTQLTNMGFRASDGLLSKSDRVSRRQLVFEKNRWDRCYFAHTDFRRRPVPKNERFVDFLSSQVQDIESGSFPCSGEIRSPWTSCMPEPLVEERLEDGTRNSGAGRFYILDGQLRGIRHWYHQQPAIPVFIYRGEQNA